MNCLCSSRRLHACAEEQRTFCKFCNSGYTDLEYKLHCLSNPHVKKVRSALLQCEFSGLCRVCLVVLRGLQDVEIHVQGQAHQGRFGSQLSTSYATNRCACEPCGVVFRNEIALEAHRLMPLHRNEAHSYPFPKLDELLRQLSGLPGEHLARDISSLCKICNVCHDSLDAYIMHLFASTHIAKLRFSSCLVCDKEFIHVDNRESHLAGSKHSSNVEKCGRILKEISTPIKMKGAYPCMFCMVGCNSWLCLELHLRYPAHALAVCRSKTEHPISRKLSFATPKKVQDDGDNACDVNAARRWREWRLHVSQELAWCHRCGVSLPDLDAANTHPEKHDPEEDQSEMHDTHEHEAAPDSSLMPDLFHCCVCTLSFKSAFFLTAHEACFQHHCRMAKFPLVKDLICCASCGSLASSEDRKADICKELDVLQRHVYGTGHEDVLQGHVHVTGQACEELCHNPAGNGDGSNLCTKNAHDLEEIKSGKLDAHNLPGKSISEIGHFSKIMASQAPMNNRMLMQDACRIKAKRKRSRVNKDNNLIFNQIETCSKEDISQNMVSHAKVIPQKNNASSALPLACAGQVESGVQQDSRVPIIAVAALAPLGAFQESLRSIMTIVAKALPSTLPTYAQHSASLSQETVKREYQAQESPEEHNEVKRICSEETMKETIHHILQSAHSTSASVAMGAKSTDKMEVVMAVGASVLLDSCMSARVRGEGNMITESQQLLVKQDANKSCELIDQSIGIELYVDQGLEGIPCVSDKFHVNHTQQPIIDNKERARDVLSHDNMIGQDFLKESSSLLGADEVPASTMDVGMPSICIKIEKDDDQNEDDLLHVSNQFKDDDLWCILSDLEDVGDNKSNAMLQTK